MKYKKITYYLLPLLGALTLSGCALSESGTFEPQEPQGELKLNLTGDISQVYQTRANDSGFCDQDEIGIYVVDFDAEGQAQRLKTTGNRADNLKHIFDEASYKWNPLHDIYWKDSKTHVDIYGYYPFQSIQDVDAQSFEVQKDQSRAAEHGRMGGYEASDFLWGKVADVSPTDRVIRVSMGHRMASVRVSLVEGQGFDSGEWVDARKDVLILNTKRSAIIDLSTGSVSASGEVQEKGILPYLHGDDFRAIVVPQTIESNVPLLSITVGGTAYTFKKAEQMTYIPGKQHNFTVTVNKKQSGEYEFTLSGESITAWENDNVSHDVTAREYIVINVPEAGTLDKCIEAAGKDLNQIANMKVTGNIDARDFGVMNSMPKLRSLNLKEAIIVELGDRSRSNKDLEIPSSAFEYNSSIVNFVFPEKLKAIGGSSFCGSNLTGSLIIPEGVESIGDLAFYQCHSLMGELSLPSSLLSIGELAFSECYYISSKLELPKNLTTIRRQAFDGCYGLYGDIRLPDSLENLGYGAFANCPSLSGSIEVPQRITDIPYRLFANGHNSSTGNLILHNFVEKIGASAFARCNLKGELKLPESLINIGELAFIGNQFSGKLILPKDLASISQGAFQENRFTGIIELPDNCRYIGSYAFANCSTVEGLVFPENFETIGSGAFQNCFGINKIVCKGTIPPIVQSGAFDGVPKDNFTVEVPESAVNTYRTAEGWSDFKRISVYRNLSCSPAVACALNNSCTRDLLLRADDEWEVESAPDWVSLSQNSGKGKTALTLTFAQMPAGTNRDGEVVFKLKDKDYRTSCHVSQYDYKYGEDEVVTLQSATKGRGVNIVLLGEGYNAQDISTGKMLDDVNEAVKYFFDIEPYKSYKDYFNVYTRVAVSPESGVGGVNTVVYNKFNTYATGGVSYTSDESEIINYVGGIPGIDDSNLDQTLIIVIPNSTDYGGVTKMYGSGLAIAYCPLSNDYYPYDFRGIVQHEAGGHGFGKLGDEYIYTNAFISACPCPNPHVDEFNAGKANGWYTNLSLSGKMNEVPWSHLLFHDKYSMLVDIYEGGYFHSRGVYRSEYNSCMNNNIPYYSAISREEIVRRILTYAGEEFNFEDFVDRDIIENTPETASTKASILTPTSGAGRHVPPIILNDRPHLNK